MNISHIYSVFHFFFFFFFFLVRTCPGLSPPQNGSLACTTHFQDSPICAFFCQNGTDFEFDPPLLYLCFEDQWEFFALPSQSYEQILPGPNCQPGKITTG